MDDPEKIYEWYQKERSQYGQLSDKHLERYEKALLIATSGATAGAFSAVVADPTWLRASLICAFIFLSISFFCALLAHYLSHKSNEDAIIWLDGKFESILSDSQQAVDTIARFRARYERSVYSLNLFAILGLICGVGLLIFTGWQKMEDKRHVDSALSIEQLRVARSPSRPPVQMQLASSDSAKPPVPASRSSGQQSGDTDNGAKK